MVLLKCLEKKDLWKIREEIDRELKARSKSEQEEYRQAHAGYLGRCFKCKDNVIKIANFSYDNEYHMMCFVLNLDMSDDDSILCLDSLGLFCNDHSNPGHQIIGRYEEISELEFQQLISTEIDQIVFGRFKCQD